MTTNVDSRERRLRKQAELQSLTINLANLRERENSYIVAQAVIPELLIQQISEVQQKIETTEEALLELGDASLKTPARQRYREAIEAEANEAFDQALKLYKSAARYPHPDAGAAARSLRYRLKKSKAAGDRKWWEPVPINRSKKFPWGLIAALLIVALIIIFAFSSYFTTSPEIAGLDATTINATASPIVVIVPDTATPLPTWTPTATPVTTPTPTATQTPPARPVNIIEDVEPTPSPTPIPTLKAAPQVIGPKDGLVWLDGAIVFEFEDLDLPYDELYCLDTLKGYDSTLTENWSFPPIGSAGPRIAIEASIFHIAELQDISCIAWSAYIGKESCNNVISRSSERRIIGLPRPCDLE